MVCMTSARHTRKVFRVKVRSGADYATVTLTDERTPSAYVMISVDGGTCVVRDYIE